MATATPKATIAGILSIVAGGTGVIGACILASIGLIGSGVMRNVPNDVPRGLAFVPLAFFLPLAGMLLILAVLSIVGGVSALRRGSFALAVAGAAAAIFTFVPLGIAALVFIILAEPELRTPPAAPPS